MNEIKKWSEKVGHIEGEREKRERKRVWKGREWEEWRGENIEKEDEEEDMEEEEKRRGGGGEGINTQKAREREREEIGARIIKTKKDKQNKHLKISYQPKFVKSIHLKFWIVDS